MKRNSFFTSIKIQNILAGTVLIVVFAALTSWSWLMWPDVLVDFGHELYVPWQMTEGQVLYRDMKFTMGPLSQYCNYFLFRIFGTSLYTLVLCNLFILAVITFGLFRIFATIAGRLNAIFVCVVFLTLFGFSQYVGVANYNYVAPYRHEMTHGILLCIALVVVLERCLRTERTILFAVAGFLNGLILLTKSEIFLAALTADCCAFGCAFFRESRITRWRSRACGIAAISSMLPVIGFMLILSRHMPIDAALAATLSNICYALNDNLTVGYKFYATNFGLTDAAANVQRMTIAYLIGTSGMSALVSLDYAATRRSLVRPALAIVLGASAFCLTGNSVSYAAWQWFYCGLPLFTLSIGIYAIYYCRVHAADAAKFRRYSLLAIWTCLALALLAKMIFRSRIDHYGFVLAMPATLLLVSFTTSLIPRHLDRRCSGGMLTKSIAIGIVAAMVCTYLSKSNEFYSRKALAIGNGDDRFLTFDSTASSRGFLTKEALRRLGAELKAGQTLLILPEGITVNYLLRVRNPTIYHLLTPWEMAAFGGEDHILATITAAEPDYIGLFLVDMSDHGYDRFGVPGYGEKIVQWVRSEYRLFQQYSLQQDNIDHFQIQLYQKRRPAESL